MNGLESVIRPFTGTDITPKDIFVPGQVGVPNVHIIVGRPGAGKTFSYSGSNSEGYAMGNSHKESAPKSDSLQKKLAQD